MVFSCFPYQNLICNFSIWRKEEHQQLRTYYKLIELFWLMFLINVRKKIHIWSCSISHSFVGICDTSLEKSLLNFYFGFDIEKTIPVYIPTHLVISFTKNHASFTKCSQVRICFILLLQKMVSQNVCCEKNYLNWNHQHICKECFHTQITHLLYRKLLSMWYLELQLDHYVEST